jgi:hypothetical protein
VGACRIWPDRAADLRGRGWAGRDRAALEHGGPNCRIAQPWRPRRASCDRRRGTRVRPGNRNAS